MFAQYNQQYQQAGGTAVSTNGLVWNGNAWVASATHAHAAPVAGGHSTYSTGESPAALVTKYTNYYHQWTARAKEHEEATQRLPYNSPQRAESQQHTDWAKYYADQSSRAAHHYHSNPHTPAPFELPPAPTTAVAAAPQQQPQQQPQQPQSITPAKKTSRWSAQGPTAGANTTAGKPSSDGGPPDSLKRYVHRCLEQCKTSEQTKTVERETEQVIAKALRAGTLHSTNWDNVPLIPVPGVTPTGKRDFHSSPTMTHYDQGNSKKQKVTPGGSYYGPSAGSPSSSIVSGNAQGNNNQGGYYGPSSSSSSPHSQNSYYQQQSNSKYSAGHYGNQDFIAVPPFGGKQKNGKKNNKYVNPNSIKQKNSKSQGDDGFSRTSTSLTKRASRFSGPGGNNDVRQMTAKGIEDRYLGKGIIGGSNKKLDETDYEHMKVKGTCMKLEKQYLRLTAPPKPDLVRPLNILQQHLKNLKTEWNSPTKRRDYLWFCSEMKSMRQDLTVQHISSAFTVEVYEFHARIALQSEDVNEFNQCQTQLTILYEKLEDPKAHERENEFVAYRIIYFVMLLLNKKYSGGSSDILNLMLSLTPTQKENPAIQHALQVRAAVAEVDYNKFFQLHKKCPNLGDKLMDLMVPTVRHWALQRICRAYRPVAEVDFVLKELGLDSDQEEGKTFLLSCGCVLNDEGTEIKTKETIVRESDLQEKRSLI